MLLSQSIITPVEFVKDYIKDSDSAEARHHSSRSAYVGGLINAWTNSYFGATVAHPEYAVVESEDGYPDFVEALVQLAQRPANQIRIWMLAETVAAGVVAAQEVCTGVPIDPEVEEDILERLTQFGIRRFQVPNADVSLQLGQPGAQ